MTIKTLYFPTLKYHFGVNSPFTVVPPHVNYMLFNSPKYTDHSQEQAEEAGQDSRTISQGARALSCATDQETA